MTNPQPTPTALAFDEDALVYDTDFGKNPTGILQRKRVHTLLTPFFSTLSNPKILELNCGTGIDANWLAQFSSNVLCTDISTEMVLKTAQKNANNPAIRTQQLDFTALNSLTEKVDIIFSNFGGMNCIAPEKLTQLLENAAHKLNENGLLALVLMPDDCWWERLYNFAKGPFFKTNRRKDSGPIHATVQGHQFPIWYYHPLKVFTLGMPWLDLMQIYPIGIFLPPSHLGKKMKPDGLLMRLLWKLEQFWGEYSSLAGFSDHYLILFKKPA